MSRHRKPTWRSRARLRERLAAIATAGTKMSDSARQWLRPGVFGGMDGVSSQVGLIAGLAGAGATPSTILAAALAAAAAGALSMGGGEGLSVQTDAEPLARQAGETQELEERFAANSEEVIQETAKLLRDKFPSLTEEQAQAQANAWWGCPEFAAVLHVAVEHGEFADDPAKPGKRPRRLFWLSGQGLC
ncbi:MAG: VIT1/CCC1 transporter family protein [Mycobacteriales bacterium]